MYLPPLILTLTIEEGAAAYFNRLRELYFPASRNFIMAHFTLFHALPNQREILETVEATAKEQPVISLLVTKPFSIGGGVVFRLQSDEVQLLHKDLQREWWPCLTQQDRQKLWPHITVQNKVSASEAQQSLAEIEEAFTPFSTFGTGLQVWEYLNGPWKQVALFNFTGNK